MNRQQNGLTDKHQWKEQQYNSSFNQKQSSY